VEDTAEWPPVEEELWLPRPTAEEHLPDLSVGGGDYFATARANTHVPTAVDQTSASEMAHDTTKLGTT
jgi:hypothetical protein